MPTEVRTATGATVQVRLDNGTVIDLELAPDALQKLTVDLAVEADIRDLPTNGPFLEREATGRRTAHLVLDGPVVRADQQVSWHRFDYEDKTTAPKRDDLVWIVEDFYESGVTTGFFDGYTFRTWAGSDDCHVSWWAPIEQPNPPAEWDSEAQSEDIEG